MAKKIIVYIPHFFSVSLVFDRKTFFFFASFFRYVTHKQTVRSFFMQYTNSLLNISIHKSFSFYSDIAFIFHGWNNNFLIQVEFKSRQLFKIIYSGSNRIHQGMYTWTKCLIVSNYIWLFRNTFVNTFIPKTSVWCLHWS